MANYIRSLQAENAELKRIIAEKENTVQELRVYLNSDKFHFDTTVQVRDVLNRLSEV